MREVTVLKLESEVLLLNIGPQSQRDGEVPSKNVAEVLCLIEEGVHYRTAEGVPILRGGKVQVGSETEVHQTEGEPSTPRGDAARGI